MRKKNSTNYINEQYWKEHCGLSQFLLLIGGRWKINILAFLLHEKSLRFNELSARLEGISEKMLAAQLKELERDRLIDRIEIAKNSAKVEYRLSGSGKALKDIIKAMEIWGAHHGNKA